MMQEGGADIEQLIHDLIHGDIRLRYIAALTLEREGTPQTVPALIQALDDDHWYIRNSIVKALSNIGDERALQPLIQQMTDPNPGVRKNVAIALGNMGDTQAVPALVNALDDSRHYVRYEVIRALGQIGNDEAIAGLAEVLNDANSHYAAVNALKRIDTPAAWDALAQWEQDN